MNERIRELAEQAVLQANEVFDQKGKDYQRIVLEKFAELIVKETMLVVAKNLAPNDYLNVAEAVIEHYEDK